jgi:hypothetical protein
MFEHLKQMKADMEAVKQTYLEKSKAAFTDVAKLIFEKHPVVESFSWAQYTPYFNDGEECVFSANTDYFNLNGQDEYEDGSKETIWRNGKDIPNPDHKPEISAAREDIQEFLSQFDDSVFRDMFGDHKHVTVTKTETIVEDHEHD